MQLTDVVGKLVWVEEHIPRGNGGVMSFSNRGKLVSVDGHMIAVEVVEIKANGMKIGGGPGSIVWFNTMASTFGQIAVQG